MPVVPLKNPQLALLCKQTVPSASGNNILLLAVGAVALRVVELAPLNALSVVASADLSA